MFNKIIEDPSFVVMEQFDTTKFYPQYYHCNISEVPGTAYFYRDIAYPITKGSQFFELFMYHLIRIKENGILNQKEEFYKPPPRTCPSLSGQALGFSQTFTAFVFLFFGFLGGFLILM